ncbi:MAG: nuclear transport factor 2 family protein [Rubricoccaceae bacterium]|nr:nuclear transport factor 2 family protein [Rubricoccaceae bacterium]
MSTILEKTQDLVQMSGTGQMIEAIKKYYAEDVEIVEATGETFQGRDTQVERMTGWMGSIEEMHDGGVHAVAADEDAGVSLVESWADVTFQDGNRMLLEEVERYRWEDGKVVHARFYYNMPGGGDMG